MSIKYSDLLETAKVQAILITDPYNLRYYSGFRGGEGFSLITEKGSRVLITDSRYTEAAGKECFDGFVVKQFDTKISVYDILTEYIKNEDIRTIGFEDESISFRMYSRLCEKLDIEGLTFVPIKDTLMVPRQIKTAQEIEYLRQAEHIGDMAFDDILGILKPGMTELEVAAELEYSMKKHGAEGFSFDTIAASGVNSSMPHAIPSEKVLSEGEFITMDFGCVYQGYCSDMTRTVCLGKATDEMKKVYNIVLSAQLSVLENLKPGMMCKDVDRIARDYITAQGYGDYFGHGLGHGVGLYIHESPAFNTRDTSIVKPGMIETDEPGIYLPGRFGVRIEDMMLITEGGCESLAKSPKELIEI